MRRKSDRLREGGGGGGSKGGGNGVAAPTSFLRLSTSVHVCFLYTAMISNTIMLAQQMTITSCNT